MANFTDIPFLNPIKFVPAVITPGVNFDDDWACNLIKSWEKHVCFRQKWQFTDETPLIMQSTVAPSDIKIYNPLGVLKGTIAWEFVATSSSGRSIYKLTLNLDALPAGVYYLYGEVKAGTSYEYKYISEPIELKVFHVNTSVIKYTNSKNTQDVPFGFTPIVFSARVEAQVCEFLPGSEVADYVNQSHDTFILSGTPYRDFKLLVGNAEGVTDYTVDLLNRIFCLNSVRINEKLFTRISGAKWEPQRVKGYPLAGWGLDITESVNQTGLHHNDEDPIIPGFIVAYDINDDLFGGTNGNNIHILDKQNT